MSAAVLTNEAFAAALGALSPPSKVALAVSGGRDSMALLHLCVAQAKHVGVTLVALSVDHGLRDDAAREAAFVADTAARLGVPHQILVWDGEAPASGVQAAARNARYRLLIEAAQATGCEALLTAHTADDQAETLFMRLTRGAGVTGLAGMRPEAMIAAGAGDPLRLLRPMLGFSRAAVTSYLNKAGQDFIDDPSNNDPHFERVRVRALLAALAEQEITNGAALAASASKLMAADADLAEQEEALFAACGGIFYSWGGVSLDRWPAPGASGAGGLARRLLFAVGAAAFVPNEADSLAAVERACDDGAATLAGALIRRWRGRLWFVREPAALTGRAGVAPSARVAISGAILWDRRFVLSTPAAGLEIAALGIEVRAALGHRAGLFQGPPEGLPAIPVVYRDGVLIGAPTLPFMAPKAVSCQPLISERFARGCVRFS
ncbi:MAG: tRNA lysidine(34) synthetase TilS [Pseudomonadota bacterium]